jgi:hypothetical protein
MSLLGDGLGAGAVLLFGWQARDEDGPSIATRPRARPSDAPRRRSDGDGKKIAGGQRWRPGGVPRMRGTSRRKPAATRENAEGKKNTAARKERQDAAASGKTHAVGEKRGRQGMKAAVPMARRARPRRESRAIFRSRRSGVLTRPRPIVIRPAHVCIRVEHGTGWRSAIDVVESSIRLVPNHHIDIDAPTERRNDVLPASTNGERQR